MRQKKLEMLKALAATQKLSQKLEQEKHLNVVQTKMMEIELNEMKQHLESLEQRRSELLIRRDELEESVTDGTSKQSPDDSTHESKDSKAGG